jgi:hypothetical protein
VLYYFDTVTHESYFKSTHDFSSSGDDDTGSSEEEDEEALPGGEKSTEECIQEIRASLLDEIALENTQPIPNSESCTGFSGVSIHRNGRFDAHLHFRGRTLHFGLFDSVQEAAKVAMLARLTADVFVEDSKRAKLVSKLGGDEEASQWASIKASAQDEGKQASMEPIASEFNKLGFKGVTAMNTKFLSMIGFNGRKLSLGSFDTVDQAARAYAVAFTIIQRLCQEEGED